MSQRHYKDQNTWPVVNLPACQAWLSAGGDMKEQWRRIITTSRDNRAHLLTLYGAPHETWTGSRRYTIWRVEHEGLVFWLLGNREKGTSIEVAHAAKPWEEIPQKDERIIVGFLDDLYVRLKTLEPPSEPWKDMPATAESADPTDPAP